MSSQAIDTATTQWVHLLWDCGRLIALYSFLRFRLQYSSLGSATLLRLCLDLPKEVEYIWKQKFRLSTALYIGCRYALLANVLYLLAIENKLGHTVRFLVQSRGRIECPWAPLRNCLVYPEKAQLFTGETHVPGLRCSGSADLPITGNVVNYNNHIRDFLYVFTVIRCIQALRVMKKVERQRYSVVSILEQGVLFFCSISIFTVTGVILQYRAPVGLIRNALKTPSHILRSQVSSSVCPMRLHFPFPAPSLRGSFYTSGNGMPRT
ncbi:hypothetical protein B0H14DRAFT_3125413 [Mycena olivaceomarginata]|nr:hypothetical protein B0H14DRAFT_3125413 [Mycena olivaceomarginata]